VTDDPIALALLDALDRTNTPLAILREWPDRLDWIYVNTSFAAIVGYTPEQVMAKSVFDLVQRSEREQMIALTDAIRGGSRIAPPALELTVLDSNDVCVPVELTLVRRDVPHGAVVVTLVHDARAKHGPLSLLEADRVSLVGALAAGFAHEINNPLTAVLLNLRALRRQVAAVPDQLHFVDDITTGAERIANNVRAFQTLASRGVRRPIDLASVVASALRLAMPTITPIAQVVKQIFPVGAVMGEESRIGQAVLAMMLFSVSGFDREAEETTGNRVTILVEERGRDAILEVSDNGRELAAGDTQHAFDPFFQSPVRGAGVGVGLGVARSVAATIGGDVALVARPGGGAVITMRLPMETLP